jgi:MoaA/NifB/PqqE/SkfB family radical SAM enzyme
MSLKHEYRAALTSAQTDDARLPLLVNDLVIEEQLCHLRCSYCLTEEFNLLMDVPDATERLTTDRHDEWAEVLRAYDAAADAPILRLSGGEFFWLPGSDDFIAAASERYDTVQVITNGLLLKPKRLERLAHMGNVQLNFSLDGHTPEMNRHRFPNRKMLDVVLHHLDAAVSLGMPVEIQTVLTGANVADMLPFCEFLAERHSGKVVVYFFPVRGKVADNMAWERADHLAPIVHHYAALESVLPPRAYVDHIANYIATDRRTLPCTIPATMLQLFGDGSISACPHAWLEPMGNVRDDADPIQSTVGRHEHYDFFLQPRPRFPFCRGCVTPSDVVNLYLFGRISDEEIARCFLYQAPRSLDRLARLRSAFESVVRGLELAPTNAVVQQPVHVRGRSE